MSLELSPGNSSSRKVKELEARLKKGDVHLSICIVLLLLKFIDSKS